MGLGRAPGGGDLHPDRLLMKIAVQDGVLYGINTFVSDTVYTYKLDLHS